MKKTNAIPDFMLGDKLKSHKQDTMYYFKSLSDWRTFITSDAVANYNANTLKHSHDTDDDNFNGCVTWSDYETLLSDGDTNVMNKIKIATQLKVKEIHDNYEIHADKFKFDVTGDFFDIGMVMLGEPETWLSPDENEKEVQKIHIKLSLGVSWKVTADDIVKRSARILAIVKVLEEQGIQVKLTGHYLTTKFCETNSKKLGVEMMIKNYSEIINFRKVTSMVTPTTQRRGFFRLQELNSEKQSDGYGYSPEIQGTVTLRRDTEIDDLETELFTKKGE